MPTIKAKYSGGIALDVPRDFSFELRKKLHGLYPGEKAVALEMAITVLRVLKEYGFEVNATASADTGCSSTVIQILKLIGDDIKIALAPVTWREKVNAAKKMSHHRFLFTSIPSFPLIPPVISTECGAREVIEKIF